MMKSIKRKHHIIIKTIREFMKLMLNSLNYGFVHALYLSKTDFNCRNSNFFQSDLIPKFRSNTKGGSRYLCMQSPQYNDGSSDCRKYMRPKSIFFC